MSGVVRARRREKPSREMAVLPLREGTARPAAGLPSHSIPQPSAVPPVARPSALSRLRADLTALVGDGITYNLMVGFGENYLPAFVLAVGMSQVTSGLIISIPLLLGGLLQLSAPWGVRYFQSNRLWCALCAAMQATAFFAFAVAAALGHMPVVLAFALASLSWGSNQATAGPWTTWAAMLVPAPMRYRFFAWRTRLCQAALLAGFLLGGLALQWGEQYAVTLPVFAGLFFIAALARYTSAWILFHQNEPVSPTVNIKPRLPTVREVGNRLHNSRDGRLLAYLLAMQACVYVSAPYFSPYMLVQCKFSYMEYMLLTAMAFLARVLALPTWGRVAKRVGTWGLLWIGGISIVPLALPWLVSMNFYYLMGVQLFAGILWAAYELAWNLLFVEALDRRERTGLLTMYNLAHASATVFGSLIGGALLVWLGATVAAYWTVFALSSSLRVLTMLLLWHLPRGNWRAWRRPEDSSEPPEPPPLVEPRGLAGSTR